MRKTSKPERAAARKAPSKVRQRYAVPRPPHLTGLVLGGYKVVERVWPQADRRSRYNVTCVRCKTPSVKLGFVLTARERAGRKECPACRMSRGERHTAKARVQRLLAEHPALLSQEIARRAGVSTTYVYYIRQGLR